MARNRKNSEHHSLKMKNKFSRSWKASKKPRKQRKYRYQAPLHIKQKFMIARLSKELQKKYNIKRIQVKKTGKVNAVNLKKERVFVENAHYIKKDGAKSFYPIHPSNLLITELIIEDKKRKNKLERKK